MSSCRVSLVRNLEVLLYSRSPDTCDPGCDTEERSRVRLSDTAAEPRSHQQDHAQGGFFESLFEHHLSIAWRVPVQAVPKLVGAPLSECLRTHAPIYPNPDRGTGRAARHTSQRFRIRLLARYRVTPDASGSAGRKSQRRTAGRRYQPGGCSASPRCPSRPAGRCGVRPL